MFNWLRTAWLGWWLYHSIQSVLPCPVLGHSSHMKLWTLEMHCSAHPDFHSLQPLYFSFIYLGFCSQYFPHEVVSSFMVMTMIVILMSVEAILPHILSALLSARQWVCIVSSDAWSLWDGAVMLSSLTKDAIETQRGYWVPHQLLAKWTVVICFLVDASI